MNKYQEALNTLVRYAHESPNVGWVLIHEENILQELVDKATPRKNIGWDCPVCSESIVDVVDDDFAYIWKHRFCPHCEQKIDWSEDE